MPEPPAAGAWNGSALPVVFPTVPDAPVVFADLPDAELLARARRGDQGAFRALVERFEPVVAGVVIGMLGGGDDADDVGQETFIRFHGAMAQFRGEASLATYLRRIAMNLSLNALKRRKRHGLRFVSRDGAAAPRLSSRPEPALMEPPVGAYDAERAERIDMVRRAVAALGEKQRAVVVLRLFDGLSTNETAAVLELPPGTVMSRLSRGLAGLKRLLAPYARDPGNDA
jgi:RNA polymerase sigma-70 factor (ECF subfamily)